ncbi:hypothetical protein [Kutzneria sp. CA-103260]|uniref:hypothetical protein n=1 Tax=Kutzneria sp. CA-103260 TaxID=2802641 RepID=UPI001BA7EFBA|nr:hypothetical protein [Kutzneria sp. CA-103260]QUQ72071.1 hypothetical protein JJ691_98580 [Kutzneria sp. CA-103260]
MSTKTRRRLAVGIAGLAAVGGIAFGASPAFADTGAHGTYGQAKPGNPQDKPDCVELRLNQDGSVSVAKCENPPQGGSAPVTAMPAR